MIFGIGTTGATYSRGHAWRRVTTIFVVLVFTLFDAVRYAPQGYASPAAPVANSAPASFSIPKELGKVEESFRGTTDKTVIFIQDAHDSLEAQENIAKLINKFVKEKGIKTVFEEGYEGPVPTDKFFGFIKDSKIKQKVSYFLLDKLRLGGAEYAHINRANDFKLIGVEDLKLYGENIKCYQESSKNRKDIEADLGELFSQITTLANQYFPKELKTWLKRKELFSEGKLPLLNYLKELQGLQIRSAQQFAKEYPAISMLLMAQTARDSKLIKQLNALDSKVVFEEILQLEQDISSTFLQNERDRDISAYCQGLSLLRKLNHIELTQIAYEAAKETLLTLDTQKLVDFIVSLTHRSLVLSKDWERHIKDAVRFYDVAQKRDGTIDQHIRTFQEGKEKTAVLVFGGFHANGIKEILRQQGFSYIVISPRITSINKRHQDYYKRLMSEGHHAFETPFLAARANRAPGYPYLAATGKEEFVRAVLRVIAPLVEAGTSDSQLIERRLADFSAEQKSQSLEEVSISGVRSEMRTEAEEIKEIVEKAYGLHVNGVPEVLTGGLGKRMNHEPYVIETEERGRLAFKFLFKDQERARYAVEFMQRLREFRLPAPELVPRRDVTASDDPTDVYIMEYRDAFYVLETFLAEGREILREDATEEHFREVGKLAARIQNAVEGFKPRHVFSYKTRRAVYETIKDGFPEMEKAMDSLAVVHGPENEVVRDALRRREQLRDLVKAQLSYLGKNFPDRGLRFTHIHNDLHLGNLKFEENGPISALFDFNLVQADHRIAEFNNLVFCITGYGFSVFRPEMFRAVLASYEQTLNVPLTPEEKVAIWESLRLRFIEEVTRVYSTKPDAAESIFRDRDAKRGWYQSLDVLTHFAPEPFIYEGTSVLEPGGTRLAEDKQRSEMRSDVNRKHLEDYLAESLAEMKDAKENEAAREYAHKAVEELKQVQAALNSGKEMDGATELLYRTYIPQMPEEVVDIRDIPAFQKILNGDPSTGLEKNVFRAKHMIRVDRFFRALTVGNFDYFLKRLPAGTSDEDKLRYASALREMKALFDSLPPKDQQALRVAIKFHDTGFSKGVESLGHEARGAAVAREFLASLPLPQQEKETIEAIILKHMQAGSTYGGSVRIQEFLRPPSGYKGSLASGTLVPFLILHVVADVASVGDLRNPLHLDQLEAMVQWLAPGGLAALASSYDQYRLEMMASAGLSAPFLEAAQKARLIADVRTIFGKDEVLLRDHLREHVDLPFGAFWVNGSLIREGFKKGGEDFYPYVKFMKFLAWISVIVGGESVEILTDLVKAEDSEKRKQLLGDIDKWVAPVLAEKLAADATEADTRALLNGLPDGEETDFHGIKIFRQGNVVTLRIREFVEDKRRSEIRIAKVEVISGERANRMVGSIRKGIQPATVFVDAEDFLNLSEAQKQEYLVLALSNKALHVVVYNQQGETKDKFLAALLKLDRVTRTGKDLDGAQRSFGQPNVPSIQLSKQILPSQEVVQRLRKRISFFKTQGKNGGTLAAALLWAWSGGEDAQLREINQGHDGFWIVAETLVNALQKSYDATLAFAVAA